MSRMKPGVRKEAFSRGSWRSKGADEVELIWSDLQDQAKIVKRREEKGDKMLFKYLDNKLVIQAPVWPVTELLPDASSPTSTLAGLPLLRCLLLAARCTRFIVSFPLPD